MQVYITPYDREWNNKLNLSSSDNLIEVYYKTTEGPLGFNMDESGCTLFQAIVNGTVWYSASGNEFYLMDTAFLAQHRLYGFNGVFMFPTEFINREMSKEKDLRLTIIKNKPYRKYNKPVKEEIPSFFTDFYFKATRQYAEHKLDELLKQGDIAIGANDSLGSRFIIGQDSVFANRLISSCEELDIPIKYVDSERDVPAW